MCKILFYIKSGDDFKVNKIPKVYNIKIVKHDPDKEEDWLLDMSNKLNEKYKNYEYIVYHFGGQCEKEIFKTVPIRNNVKIIKNGLKMIFISQHCSDTGWALGKSRDVINSFLKQKTPDKDRLLKLLDGLFYIQMLELYLDEVDENGFDIDEKGIFYKIGENGEKYYISPENTGNGQSLLEYELPSESGAKVSNKVGEFPFNLIYEKKNGEINPVEEEVKKMKYALEQIKKKDDILEVIYNLIAIAIDLQGILEAKKKGIENVEDYIKEVESAYDQEMLKLIKDKLSNIEGCNAKENDNAEESILNVFPDKLDQLNYKQVEKVIKCVEQIKNLA
ncbi:MAG: hypothetical protein DRP29_05285 [Thermodesulfobacteriota bacterium]|nr:MAG: hypothetical protein DRP29_05285 [Thermodesulfobacteriota bacterium]